MKKIISIALFILAYAVALHAQNEYITEQTRIPDHPRILLLKGEEKALKKNIAKDPFWTSFHQTILNTADVILDEPVNERIVTGRRLLPICHDNLKRILYLSYAYRMTGDKIYAKRAEAEMLKAATFSDWNPSHFLDTSEMTMALAIGYDWLYSVLSTQSKAIIAKAIREKGLDLSCDSKLNGFLKAVNNWNQVCNAGMSYGALAIWENDPAFSRMIVNRAVETIQPSMSVYAPNGAYPEGAGYWEYGTTFNVLFISELEKVFKTDFGLSSLPGFLKTGEYILNMVSPGLQNFAFSDCVRKGTFKPALFWFYDKTKDDSILYRQASMYDWDFKKVERNGKEYPIIYTEFDTNLKRQASTGKLFAPITLIWGATASISNPSTPKALNYKAEGETPVCIMRSSWTDPGASYIAVKGGKASSSHAHMDAGSFVYESDGVMWAIDMGIEDYNKLEVAGVSGLWGRTQDAQRWDVFRYNNFAHNTLTFNKSLQLVKGHATIERFVEGDGQSTAVIDLTSVYDDQVSGVKRAVSLVGKRDAVIEDQVKSTGRFTMLTWTLVTEASVSQVNDHMLLLEKDGKKMYMKVDCPTDIRWDVHPAIPIFSYDSPNPGVTIICFNTDLGLNATQTVKVTLTPDAGKAAPYNPIF